MVKIKSAYKINDDLTVEDEGFKITLTAEEMKVLDKLAKGEGITRKELIDRMISSAGDDTVDEITQRVKDYQKNAT